MSHIIIKQPNGKYAVWSTIIDHFLYKNRTINQVIRRETRFAIKDAKTETKAWVNQAVNDIEKYGVSYGGRTYESLLEFQKEFDDELDDTENNPEADKCH